MSSAHGDAGVGVGVGVETLGMPAADPPWSGAFSGPHAGVGTRPLMRPPMMTPTGHHHMD